MANHHLIPEELMKDNKFKQVFERLKKIGWDGDGASNGAFLPGSQDLASKLGIPGHWSSHSQYTAEIRSKLAALSRQAAQLSDTSLALKVKEIQDWARAGLDNGLFKVDPTTGRLL